MLVMLLINVCIDIWELELKIKNITSIPVRDCVHIRACNTCIVGIIIRIPVLVTST